MSGLSLALLLAVSCSSIGLESTDNNLYLVRAVDKRHPGYERSQTGFRIRSMRGVITALHGVLDSPSITVTSDRNGKLFTASVTVVYFDRERDLAVLSGPELEAQGNVGFDVADKISLRPFDTVYVRGHPYGTGLLGNRYIVADPVLEPLKKRLLPELRIRLNRLNSPSPETLVLNIQGNLTPGHSGAPIFNADGQVIAVANGGLEEGRTDKSWAIPLQDVNWRPTANNASFATLSSNSIEGLFSVQEYKTAVIADLGRVNTKFQDSLRSIVSASDNGFTNLIAEPDSRKDTFKSKVGLPGSVEMIVKPYHSVQAWMGNSENMADAEGIYDFLLRQVRLTFPNWKHEEKSPYVQQPIKSFVSTSPNGETYISLYLDRRGGSAFFVKLNVFTRVKKP